MPSILIVDDDIYLTKLLGKMLVREGYSVETAESGFYVVKLKSPAT